MDKLFPYQEEGCAFLTNRKLALLADEMGLGKTVQAIRGLDAMAAHRVIIICPSVARINWAREFDLWSEVPREITVLSKLKSNPPQHGVVICSFDYAKENSKKLAAVKWDALVIDESHLLKSHKAKRTAAILGAQGIIHASKRCWLLSGTPAPNNPSELWVMLRTFGVYTADFDTFIERFCVTRRTSYGIKIEGANRSRIPELKKLLNKIMLRRMKKDVMKQLPPISYGYMAVEPGLVDLEIQAGFVKYYIPTDQREQLMNDIEAQEKLLGDVSNNMIANGDMLTAIQGISSSVPQLRMYVGLQKVQPTIDLVSRELQDWAYEKIVIFAIHRDVIESLRVGLSKFGAVTIYGGTDPKRRQKNIDKFQNNPKCRVFIGNIQAAGVAITLTAAHHVLFVEQDWVPGNNAQAVMRCHRIGQENPVSVRFMAIADSLDSRIMEVVKRKVKDLTMIFDKKGLQLPNLPNK